MISKFLKKLSKREIIIFYLAIAIVFMVISDRFIFGPLLSKIRLLDKEIENKERLLKKTLHIISQRQRIEKENEIYTAYSVQASSKEEEVASLLKIIENFASETGVQIIDIKPRKITSEGDLTKKYIVDLNFESEIDKAFVFMYKIDSSNLLIRVERFSAIPKAKGSSMLRFNTSVSKTVVLGY